MKKDDMMNDYYKNHEVYLRKMKPIWEREGLELRQKRELLHVSQKELGLQIGVSPSLISRLELGRSVSRRTLLKKAYLTAIELFLRKQQEHLTKINL